MADPFIGHTVLVTLPNGKLRGTVSHAIAQQLTLSEVTWLSTGTTSEILVIDAQDIRDLELQKLQPQPTIQSPILDPAIVGYTRQNSFGNGLQPGTYLGPRRYGSEDAVNDTKALSDLQRARANSSISPVTSVAQSRIEIGTQEVTPLSANLTEPFQTLSLESQANEERPTAMQELPAALEPVRSVGKKTKYRQPISSPARDIVYRPKPAQSQEPHAQKSGKRRKRSKWKDTPAGQNGTISPRLQSMSQHLSPAHYNHPVQRRRYKGSEYDEQNGWATGEATDIQEMGDFDFEENHKKFDKQKVFDQIRQEDTTADEARLVSFNRLPARAGTAGGKNLHYTENVLDSPKTRFVEHSSDSEVEFERPKVSSDRSSLRDLSRASLRKPPSRKDSMLTTSDPLMRKSSTASDLKAGRSRRPGYDKGVSPNVQSGSFRSQKTSNERASLRLVSSQRTCPCITPLQMLELEQLATSQLGLTEDMITENAARAIAETSLRLAMSRVVESDLDDVNKAPVIVVLAGNNKTGSRAIAAARHLRNHGARIVLCILGLEREAKDDLLESVRAQLEIFRNCGGKAIKQEQLPRTLRTLKAPTSLIVDSMLGIHLSFDDLRTDDQAAYFSLVCWANGSLNVDIVAIDVPSGIDASTGIATSHDSQPLSISAHHILSLGAPKTGLLLALGHGDNYNAHRSLLVADIGISNTAWRKFGTRKRHGVDFGGQWVAALEWVDGLGI